MELFDWQAVHQVVVWMRSINTPSIHDLLLKILHISRPISREKCSHLDTSLLLLLFLNKYHAFSPPPSLMDSPDNNNNNSGLSDYRDNIIKDHRNSKRMGLSEKSKTFTIESLLRSDENDKSASAISPSVRPSAVQDNPLMRLSLKPDAMTCDLLNRLDFTRRQDPHFFNWLRLQNPVAASTHPTHYLLSELPGN